MKFKMLILFLGTVFIFGCGNEIEVEVISPTMGSIQESFTEPAQTRLSKTYPITMPVDGRIDRIELEPGDIVSLGQQLVKVDLIPIQEEFTEAQSQVNEFKAQIIVKDDISLEKTALADMEQMVEASKETLKASEAEVTASKAHADRAAKELKRTEKLAKTEVVTKSKLDDDRLAAEVSLIELRKQEFYKAAFNAMHVAVQLGPKFVNQYISLKKLQRGVLVHQLAQAKSRLARAEHQVKLANISSPIGGLVLEKYEEGNSTLVAGQKLLLLGNMDDLEVIADILTQDALLLKKGSTVILKPAHRIEPIRGKVRRIEPAGFTKLSSLGVEQQRVNVIVSLESAPENLGVNYRVQATFITGEKEKALLIPRYSVLQSPDQSYYVLLVEDGKIKKQTVELGLQSDLQLEIIKGLKENDVLIEKPDTTMQVGTKVKKK